MKGFSEFERKLMEEVDHLVLCGLHPWQISNKVVEMVYEYGPRKVNILKLFAKDLAMEKILEPGELMIKAGITKSKVTSLGVSSKEGLGVIDQSHYVHMYESVFRAWEDMGWINISVDNDDDSRSITVSITDE